MALLRFLTRTRYPGRIPHHRCTLLDVVDRRHPRRRHPGAVGGDFLYEDGSRNHPLSAFSATQSHHTGHRAGL